MTTAMHRQPHRDSRLRVVRQVAAFVRRPMGRVVLTLAILGASTSQLFAQIDPLIGVKRVPPNVIIVFDTSFPMLFDGNGNYYDVKTYSRSDDVSAATAMNVTAATYRRKYTGLTFEAVINGSSKYIATDIIATPSTDPSYGSFWAPSRFGIAKSGLAQAVTENLNMVRWGLVKLRQSNEAWRNVNGNNCDKPVRVTGNAVLQAAAGDASPCNAGSNRYAIYAPEVTAANFSVTSGSSDALMVAVGSNNANANIGSTLQQTVGSGSLIPAGLDSSTYVDRPLTDALTDTRAHVVTTMTADALRACRNTVIVLVTSGKDSGNSAYTTTRNPLTTAATFASVTANGATRRVPIVVVGVKPAAADEAMLAGIASASGGTYIKATSVAEMASAVNYAVQKGFSKPIDFDAPRASEYTSTSPVVGTVNLAGASSASGTLLTNTEVTSTIGQTTGLAVPQRSNFLLTAGYALPGFEGHLRAFRVYRPVADSTKPMGWRFDSDGTKLWPDLDDRPTLAGLARVPFSASARNIYTYIPNGTGGGQVVPFDISQSSVIGPHLGGADPATLIPFVRNLPIGAVIGSTPAIMDPPSLDPPPDPDYGFTDGVGTFAGTHKDRRSIIFFGANDGMIHAVDARTGYEVWAFIPYNLLPKLRTLTDGQSVEQFDYFVDSSPKIAEVKIGGSWRSLLVIGQAYGGVFYTAFDVTEAGMGVAPDADGISAVNSMLAKFDTVGESIQFKWAFPNFNSFDPTINFSAPLSDGFPGSRITLYGDLKATANAVEKRVGFTFSDPAVGTLKIDRSLNAAITGSGYFPAIESLLPNRGSIAAGRSLFMLNMDTGVPIGNPSGTACSGTGCLDIGDVSNNRKNALQADVTASSTSTSTAVSVAYAGDIDGRYWRFGLADTGAITSTLLVDTDQPIYSSSALLLIGTNTRYLFFGTGSDQLSASTPGGGSNGQGTAFRLYGVQDNVTSGTVTLSRSLDGVSSTGLLTNGERPTASPTVAGDIVFFTTTVDTGATACSDAISRVYAFTYLGTAAYDSNGNGKLDNNESPVVATSAGRGTAPFIVDQHLFFSTSSLLGAGVTMLGDASDFNNGVGQAGVRILSWREIR